MVDLEPNERNPATTVWDDISGKVLNENPSRTPAVILAVGGPRSAMDPIETEEKPSRTPAATTTLKGVGRLCSAIEPNEDEPRRPRSSIDPNEDETKEKPSRTAATTTPKAAIDPNEDETEEKPSRMAATNITTLNASGRPHSPIDPNEDESKEKPSRTPAATTTLMAAIDPNEDETNEKPSRTPAATTTLNAVRFPCSAIDPNGDKTEDKPSRTPATNTTLNADGGLRSPIDASKNPSGTPVAIMWDQTEVDISRKVVASGSDHGEPSDLVSQALETVEPPRSALDPIENIGSGEIGSINQIQSVDRTRERISFSLPRRPTRPPVPDYFEPLEPKIPYTRWKIIETDAFPGLNGNTHSVVFSRQRKGLTERIAAEIHVSNSGDIVSSKIVTPLCIRDPLRLRPPQWYFVKGKAPKFLRDVTIHFLIFKRVIGGNLKIIGLRKIGGNIQIIGLRFWVMETGEVTHIEIIDEGHWYFKEIEKELAAK